MGLLDLFRRRKASALGTKAATTLAMGWREELWQEIERCILVHPETERVERLVEEYGLRVWRKGSPQIVYLTNLFEQTREASQDERGRRIAKFAAAIFECNAVADSWEDVEERVLPVVRPCTFGLTFGSDGDIVQERLARPLLPYLDEVIAVDNPNSVLYPTSAASSKWGVETNVVFERARANLRRLASAEMELYDQSRGPIFHLPQEDLYAGSLLLLPSWLASFRNRVEGSPIAIIPDCTSLLIGGDGRPELVQWLAEKAQREWQAANRRGSPVVYTADADGRLVAYERGGHDALESLLRRGHTLLRAREYAEQTEVLRAHYERKGIDLFVSEHTLINRKDGQLLSYAVWADGVDCVLPSADVVFVCGQEPEKWVFPVRFEDAREIANVLWKPAEVPGGPARYRISDRMSATQKAAFQAAQVDIDKVQLSQRML